MKPLRLMMCGFGPFGKEVIVDFTKFSKKGVFLITGDTGAGKTTIFDGITFALFGEVSGMTRPVTTVRSDYAAPTEKTVVSLTFEQKGKQYRVTRNPAYTRQKKRGTGTTSESADAVLEMPDGRIITKTQPVTKKITEILGVTLKQFKQIAMIAQGEFLDIVLADSTQRSQIFRRVFDTQLYGDLQDRLKEQSSILKQQCQEQDQRITQLWSGVLCPEESNYLEEFSQIDPKGILYDLDHSLNFLNSLIAQDEAIYTSIQKRKRGVEKMLSDNIAQLAKGDAINKKLQDLEQAKQDLAGLEAMKDEQENEKARYALQYQAFYTVRPLEEQYRMAQINFLDLQQGITAQKALLQRATIDLTNKRETYEKVLPYQKEIEALASEITAEKNQLSQYDAIEKLRKAEDGLKKELQFLKASHKKLEQQKAVAEERQKIAENEMLQYDNLDTRRLSAHHQAQQLEILFVKLQEIKKLMDRFQAVKQKLALAQNDFLKVQTKHIACQEEYLAQEALFFQSQAGILATQLKPGSKCPVCGSREHPEKAVLQECPLSEEELKQKRITVDRARQEMEQTHNHCIELRQDCTNIQKQLLQEVRPLVETEEKDLDALKKLLREKEAQRKQQQTFLQREIAEIEALESRSVVLQEELKELSEKSVQREKEQLKLEQKQTQIRMQVAEISGKIQSMAMHLHFPDQQAAKLHLNRLEQQMAEKRQKLKEGETSYLECQREADKAAAVLREKEQALPSAQKALQLAEQKYLFERKNAGFETEESYHGALSTEDQIERKREQIASYEKACALAQARYHTLQSETQGAQYIDLNRLQASCTQIEDEKAVLEEQIQTIYRRLKNNESVLHAMQKEAKTLGSLQREAVLVEHLSKTANGMLKNKQKIAFEQYIQAFYFRRVIEAANQRLTIMTSGRYWLERRETALDKQKQFGLELDVFDNYTGKFRPVNTLSGGESFKVALSMALGFLDIVQEMAGGVEIDTMFIDEGFGSLDSESLEQALQVLDRLSEGNRLVGIISHVGELKNRIDQKIVVTKGIHGSQIKMETL